MRMVRSHPKSAIACVNFRTNRFQVTGAKSPCMWTLAEYVPFKLGP